MIKKMFKRVKKKKNHTIQIVVFQVNKSSEHDDKYYPDLCFSVGSRAVNFGNILFYPSALMR